MGVVRSPLRVPVLDPNPAAQAYLAAASRIPAGHWALVKEIEISDDHPTGKAHDDGRIRLPAELHQGQLWHEGGHLVGGPNTRPIRLAFEDRFWPGGKPVGKPASDYGARHGAEEDWPETYRRILRGDRDTVRLTWARRSVPEFEGW